MTLALLAALGITVCYGLATVLQSVGARKTTASDSLDPGLIVRLLGSVPYLIGLGLDGLGYVLTVVALQTLPLFVVEAFTAGALAVTAVAAATWLRIPLSRGEWIGVVAVTLGLVALGLSAGEDRDVALTATQKWLPLAAAALLLVLTAGAARLKGRISVTALGALAGLGFGLVGIATRTLDQPLTVAGVLTDPSARSRYWHWPPPCSAAVSRRPPRRWWSPRRSSPAPSGCCSSATRSAPVSNSSH